MTSLHSMRPLVTYVGVLGSASASTSALSPSHGLRTALSSSCNFRAALSSFRDFCASPSTAVCRD